jgi:hypothetical protein
MVEPALTCFSDNEINLFLINNVSHVYITSYKPYGPHIFHEYLNKPVRVYIPNLDRNLIGT